MEIGASDAPASCGSSVWHSCACRRVGRGRGLTKPWTNMALGRHPYTRENLRETAFTRNGSRRAL